MVKILHTADWQIGRTYSRFDPHDGVPLAEARFESVERIAGLAHAEQVDVVVVAGDVFDLQTLSERAVRRMFNAVAGFGGRWVMIPGNHDAALADGVWAQAGRLGAIPANVEAVLAPRIVELSSAGAALLCAPLTQRHTYDDLTAWFDSCVTAAGWVRIGVAHGAMQGVLAEDLDSANPIAGDRAARAKLDYLALGDWHGTKRIDERTWYSGTPEQDRFKSSDTGQVLLVTIDGPGETPCVEARRVGRYRWCQETHTLAVPTDLDDLVRRLGGVGADDVLKLTVTGSVDLAQHQRLQQALGEAAGRVRVLESDFAALTLAPTADDIAALRADGYLGDVIRELQDMQAGGDDATAAQDALGLLTTVLASRGLKAGTAS